MGEKRYLKRLATLIRELDEWHHRYSKELENYPQTIDCGKKLLTGLLAELRRREKEVSDDD